MGVGMAFALIRYVAAMLNALTPFRRTSFPAALMICGLSLGCQGQGQATREQAQAASNTETPAAAPTPTLDLVSPVRDAFVTMGWNRNTHVAKYRSEYAVDLVSWCEASGCTNVPVSAVMEGTVTSIRAWSPADGRDPDTAAALGNRVHVTTTRGEDRFTTTYAHLGEFSPLLKVGTKVDAGTLIGYEGATGNATAKHLHLVVRNRAGQSVPFSINGVAPTHYAVRPLNNALSGTVHTVAAAPAQAAPLEGPPVETGMLPPPDSAGEVALPLAELHTALTGRLSPKVREPEAGESHGVHPPL